jgi:fucose 4-O-acetylase-like acetyltransferase
MAGTLNRDTQLDIVRGLAIISVVAIHTAQVATIALEDFGYTFSWFDSLARGISEFGKYGVE